MMNKEEQCWLCSQSQVVAASDNWELPRIDLLYYAYDGGPAFGAVAYYKNKTNFSKHLYINYCPICGKKLNT